MNARRLGERILLLGGLVVLIGVGVWLVSSGGADPAPDADVEAPDNDPDIDDADPIDSAGPLDGLESLQLPITVAPSEGLVDEDVVEVTGSGFTPDATIAIVQCWLGDDGGSRDDCDLGSIGVAFADSDGVFRHSMSVYRFIDTENGVFDCASGEATEGCRLGVGNTLDLDESGGAALFFAPVEAVVPPTIEATPTTGLRDGDLMLVTGRDFVPGSQVEVTQCPVGGFDDASHGCTSRNRGEVVDVDSDGALELTVVAARQRVSEDGPHDCALEVYGCMLVVRALGSFEIDETNADCAIERESTQEFVDVGVDCGAVYVAHRSPNPIPLVFDPSDAPTLPSEYTVTPSQGLVDGSVVRLDVYDMPADGTFSVAQCADGGPRGLFCASLGAVEIVDGRGGIDVVVVSTLWLDDDAIDCTEPARRCYLTLDGELAEEIRGPLRFSS